MRPANQYQAEKHMEHLLSRKLTGNRHTKVKEHTRRAKRIAAIIWTQFQVGPYQYQIKHLHWYLHSQTKHLKPATRYRYWLTIKNILKALNKEAGWIGQLQGTWIKPEGAKHHVTTKD
ncbi:MAG: hypothetical protein COC09_02390 [Gammaproteobacteria bacterium]|nr:MAG: hypothetical protein COC09_02390 [Gammaproteobacteria bacterium]